MAPHLYRALVGAAVSGLRRGGAGGRPDPVRRAAPDRQVEQGPQRNLKPLTFLRSFFTGRAAQRVDGFAYHPYTRPPAPSPRAPADDATIRSYGRVLRALDSARERGKLRRR